MEEYKCIKGFSIPVCDIYGEETDEWKIIEVNTIWGTPEEDYRMIGGEIRLESDNLGWLEITKEMFEEYFKIID